MTETTQEWSQGITQALQENVTLGFIPGITEVYGANRSGKTLFNAKEGWEVYLAGKKVYCNCPKDPNTGEYDCIILYTHYHYDPRELFQLNLYDCFVLMDESGNFMDSAARTQMVRDLYKWGYQVKKRGIKWNYDTVRGKNIEYRVRSNPDFWVQTIRSPKDWHKPLSAVKIKVTNVNGVTRRATIRQPERYFKLYNHTVLVQPVIETK